MPDILLPFLTAVSAACAVLVALGVLAEPRRCYAEAVWLLVRLTGLLRWLLDGLYARLLPGLRAPFWLVDLNFRLYGHYCRTVPVQAEPDLHIPLDRGARRGTAA